MAKRAKPSKTRKKKKSAPRGRARRILRWSGIVAGALVVLVFVVVALFALVNPPTTHTIWSEGRRLGGVERRWVPLEEIAPVMVRSAVAAEDANYCLHWGFDMAAIRSALSEGASRGASTISQQVVKNVFLWQERSWVRKALEALLTPVVELVWTKRRVLEVYLNVAEFGEGVFGVEAAAQRNFGVSAADLGPVQAARLAAVLPAPKQRSARQPDAALRNRASAIADGAATIRADGRAACFES